MTQDQAVWHLKSMVEQLRGDAEGHRKMAGDYRIAANDADDADLQRVHFDTSSRCAADARACDRNVEALQIVISSLMAVQS